MNFSCVVVAGLFLFGFLASPCHAQPADKEGAPVGSDGIYAFTVETIDGEQKSLADYKGKALLIVNTASRCGYTKQYQSLQALYAKYKDQGLEVLAFPANNFLNQEPGTDGEIKSFCLLRYKTAFPLFSKISVKGKDIHPLFAFLTSRPGTEGPVTWNFNKFLVDPSGQVVTRFDSAVDPLSPQITERLISILPQ